MVLRGPSFKGNLALPALAAGCLQACFRRTGGSWSRDLGGSDGPVLKRGLEDPEEVLKRSDLGAEANILEPGEFGAIP